MSTRVVAFGAALALGLMAIACEGDDEEPGAEGGGADITLPDTGPDTGMPDGGEEGGDPDDVPTEAAALLAWLETGHYTDWVAEPAPHAGGGAHFGDVRVYFSPDLVGSLIAGGEPHPIGAASVKELYGEAGSPVVRGWAVSVKAASGSGADSWYWYEYFDGAVVADGLGAAVCAGCHAQGLDYVRSPLP